MLVLLAGLGPRPALSRRQVARRLDLDVAQTRRIEQRGLRRLGVLDGAGRCVAGGGSEVGFVAMLASGPFGASNGSTPATAGDSGTPRSGVKGVSASGGGGGDDGGGSGLGGALPLPFGQGSDWTLLILLMLAATVVVLVRRELKRR